VKTAKGRKAQLEKELEELNDRKLQMIAEYDAQEELDDDEEQAQALAGNGVGEVSMDGVDDVAVESSGDKQQHDFVDDGKASRDAVPPKPKAVSYNSQFCEPALMQ
jgi:hypothetical protein